MIVKKTKTDFSSVHDCLEDYLNRNLLVMASSAILQGQDVVDFYLTGYQDRENKVRLSEDSIYRIFSNTKLISSVAAMCLWEEGKFKLNDPLYEYIPQFKNLVVLKEDSLDPNETEPLSSHATVKNLMTHTAGFTYGLFLESPIDSVYTTKRVLDPRSTLSEMVTKLETIPLANQPGKRWRYSVSVDILGRLIEIWSGKSFGEFLHERIFEPLSMKDTDFYVPEEKQQRFCVSYDPANLLDPMERGLTVGNDGMMGGYTAQKPFESGGGLVSTLPDYTRFMQMLMGGGIIGEERVIQPETLELMHTNQLDEGVGVQLPNWHMPNTKFGLGFAIKEAPMEGEPKEAIGEYHWGGLAGTHTWISPKLNIAALVFTQRMFGFWHPFSLDYKNSVYKAFTK